VTFLIALLFVHTRPSFRAVREQHRSSLPIHVTSAGLALMAYQDKALQSEYLEQFADPAGKVTQDAVRALLSDTVFQGFAQLAGVVDADIWGIDVPVLDGRHRALDD
jgi:DNA-binding IclR family transcriptional regulator